MALNLDDLGIASDQATTPVGVFEAPQKHSLVQGSVVAQAVLSVWQGQPVTVVQSPPGAGKTTLVVELITHLRERMTDLRVGIVHPTRAGAFDIAERLQKHIDESDLTEKIAVNLVVNNLNPPANIVAARKKLPSAVNSVNIRTLASAKGKPESVDVLIVDEAFQATFAAVVAAAANAEQVVMVGDPGQIGPVVTGNMSFFNSAKVAPQAPAPTVFARRADAKVLALNTTYRVGPDTVKAIAPLYDFAFTSGRPDRFVTGTDGVRRSEISSVTIGKAVNPSDLTMIREVANIALSKLGLTYVEVGSDGTQNERTIKAQDVAVVVPHRVQESGITALVTEAGHPGITVGTADRLQGGQWPVVVSVDPTVGYDSAASMQANPGRLCVMASRHMANLTWVHDGGWKNALDMADETVPADHVRRGREARKVLCK